MNEMALEGRVDYLYKVNIKINFIKKSHADNLLPQYNAFYFAQYMNK